MRKKQDDFTKDQEAAKEQREQRHKELEELKQYQVEKTSQKAEMIRKLEDEGIKTNQEHLEEHEANKENLLKQINDLKKTLHTKEEANRVEEAKLTAQFESADKMYAEALDAYDTELANAHQDLDAFKEEYEEKKHELNALLDEWHHRCEERRKAEEIQNLI